MCTINTVLSCQFSPMWGGWQVFDLGRKENIMKTNETYRGLPVVEVDYINLTPHDINVYDVDGETYLFTVPPSGTVARARQTSVVTLYHRVRNFGGVMAPFQRNKYGEVYDLPAFDEENILIVSRLTGEAALSEGRTDEDLAIPGQGIRDEHGVIIGCTGVCGL